ncbi:MAG: ATP-binding protein [Clostridia bacterium]|nr:ATP-binding protein [Clostridia bacterium]
MEESIRLHYTVPGDDFTRAGAASGNVKRTLKELGVSPAVIRNVSIAMYEGEINMVIHANGGEIDVEITENEIIMTLRDQGPGIENVELAMKEGFSTAPDNIRTLGFGAGMGLPNIKKYTDEFSIDTKVGVGTTLNMKVKIQ